MRLSGLRLYLTTSLNLLGDAISSVAIPLAMLVATGSVSLAAALVAATQLPQLVLSLPLSALADRLPRKPLVVLSFIVEGITSCVLSAALIWGTPTLSLVIVLGGVKGLFSSLGISATAGYIPQVLGRDNLLRYHSRVESIEGGVAIVGPPITGGIVAAWGGAVAILVPAVSSIVNGVIYAFLPAVTRSARSSSVGRVLRSLIPDMISGLKYVLTSRFQQTILIANLASQRLHW